MSVQVDPNVGPLYLEAWLILGFACGMMAYCFGWILRICHIVSPEKINDDIYMPDRD